MTIIKVSVYNDMGHLYIYPYDTLPKHIINFIFTKAKSHINYATDSTGYGAMYYILKPNISKIYGFKYDKNTFIVTYDIDIFNPRKMIMK